MPTEKKAKTIFRHGLKCSGYSIIQLCWLTLKVDHATQADERLLMEERGPVDDAHGENHFEKHLRSIYCTVASQYQLAPFQFLRNICRHSHDAAVCLALHCLATCFAIMPASSKQQPSKDQCHFILGEP